MVGTFAQETNMVITAHGITYEVHSEAEVLVLSTRLALAKAA